jgi:hypothetical protein
LIYEPAIPVPWIVCIAVAVLGAGAYHQFRSARRLGPVRNTFLLVTRLAALALLAMVWVAGFDTGRPHPAQTAHGTRHRMFAKLYDLVANFKITVAHGLFPVVFHCQLIALALQTWGCFEQKRRRPPLLVILISED